MNKRVLKSLLFIGMTSMLWGCYPDGPEYYGDYDIVYTNYEKDFNFSNHRNYAIPDRVVKIEGNIDQGAGPAFVSDVYAIQMLERMKSNMASLGYTLVSDTTDADFVLFPSALETTNVGYYYDYWGYYYGWYYPPYGGWYYPYPMTYSYQSGSLIMNLIDNKNLTPDDKHTVVWVGIVNGLLEGTSADFSNRMNKGVDQAFTQSQYLHQ